MKIRILQDVKIECEPPSHTQRYYLSQEERAKRIEEWIQEFHMFIRDHRSQDPVHLSVDRIYANICSFCKREWEEDEDGPLCCSEANKEAARDREVERSLANGINTN